MAWITSRNLYQEAIIDPHTGIKKIISVKITGTSEKAKQEAFKRLTEKINKIGDPHVKLSAAIDLYIKENEKNLKPSSIRKVTIELEQFLKIVGDADMTFISAGFIRKKLLESGKGNRTLNGYLKVFKTFWMWAYRNDLVNSREVFDKLTAFNDTPEKERIQDKYLEPKDIAKLLEGMNEERHRLLFEFLILSGLRVGEAICLTKGDVSGEAIRVNKTYDANNKVVTSAKTYTSNREVYIQPELRDCINRMNEYVKKQEEVFGTTSILFYPDIDGGYYSYHTFCKYLKENSERILGRKCSPHIARHTHASILFSRGMSLESVSHRLGHEDSAITKEIYLHRLEEMKEKENRQLDGIRLLS